MTFYVENETDLQLSFPVQEVVDCVINEILEMENCPYEVEVNILLTNNNGIHRYNKEFRGIDRPTDVLSFPNIEYEVPSCFSAVEDHLCDYFEPDSGELILGDIIISLEKVKEQALSFAHSEKREFAFLVAHSMLHLCGYDHTEEYDTKIMEEKQKQALEQVGITREASF